MPPLFTEPGWGSTHTAAEIGIDDFQASRSPDKKFYRTTPLKGQFVRARKTMVEPWHPRCTHIRDMSTEPDFPQPAPAARPVVYQFTVLRGMATALVIETHDWYSGLLQAALARVRLEGQN